MKLSLKIILLLLGATLASSCILHKREGKKLAERNSTPVGTVNIPDTTSHTHNGRVNPDPSPAPIPNPNPNPPSPNPPDLS